MTIKNTLINISAEDGELVTNIENTAPTKTNSKSNFSTNQKLKITFFDFYEEDNEPREVTISIPTSELVRLGYLQENYYTKQEVYTKTEVDAHIKLHYEVLTSINELPTAAQVKQQGKTNYIYLVPFSPNEEGTTGVEQEGYFNEYIYMIDDDGTNERMEKVGSTKIDLRPYLKIADLNSELLNCSNFITVQNDVNTLKTSKVDVQQSVANGVLVTGSDKKVKVATEITTNQIENLGVANGFVTTNANKKIQAISTTIPSTKITNGALEHIGTGKDTSQSDINSSFDNNIGNLQGRVSNLESNEDLYELKSEVQNDIWGTTGLILQTNPSPVGKKLGEYVYDYLEAYYYNKETIDSTIANLSDLQQSTINIL